MAFQEVNTTGNFVNLTKLALGEAYEGYIVRFSKSNLRGKEITNIVMINASTEEEQTLGASGNLKYMVDDQKLAAGQRTRITRIADKKVGGLVSSQFKVEQDPEDTLSDSQFQAVETGSPTVNVKQLAADKVKQAAEALTAQATGSRKAK